MKVKRTVNGFTPAQEKKLLAEIKKHENCKHIWKCVHCKTITSDDVKALLSYMFD